MLFGVQHLADAFKRGVLTSQYHKKCSVLELRNKCTVNKMENMWICACDRSILCCEHAACFTQSNSLIVTLLYVAQILSQLLNITCVVIDWICGLLSKMDFFNKPQTQGTFLPSGYFNMQDCLVMKVVTWLLGSELMFVMMRFEISLDCCSDFLWSYDSLY